MMWTLESQRGVKLAGMRPSAKADATIAALARQFVPEALAVLEELLTSPKADPASALLAAETILNVSVGRPPTRTIEVEPKLSPEENRKRCEMLKKYVEVLHHYARTRGVRTEEVEHLEALVAASEDELPEFT